MINFKEVRVNGDVGAMAMLLFETVDLIRYSYFVETPDGRQEISKIAFKSDSIDLFLFGFSYLYSKNGKVNISLMKKYFSRNPDQLESRPIDDRVVCIVRQMVEHLSLFYNVSGKYFIDRENS